MALPQAREARDFYQAAKQRFEDAQFLLDAGRTTGAVYLAGYSVECMLKALILSALPLGRRKTMIDNFRGRKAHDFEWLKMQYARCGAPPLPTPVSRAFTRVNTWGIEMRYRPGAAKQAEAEAFLKAVEEITTWADERM